MGIASVSYLEDKSKRRRHIFNNQKNLLMQVEESMSRKKTNSTLKTDCQSRFIEFAWLLAVCAFSVFFFNDFSF